MGNVRPGRLFIPSTLECRHLNELHSTSYFEQYTAIRNRLPNKQLHTGVPVSYEDPRAPLIILDRYLATLCSHPGHSTRLERLPVTLDGASRLRYELHGRRERISRTSLSHNFKFCLFSFNARRPFQSVSLWAVFCPPWRPFWL